MSKKIGLPAQRALAAHALLQAGQDLNYVREAIPAYRGRCDKSILWTLRTMAQRHGLEWPVIRRPRTTDEDHRLKRQAWDLRVQGFSWAEVAEALGIEPDRKGRDLVVKWAKRWGIRKGLDRSVLEDADRNLWASRYHADHKAGIGWKAIERKWNRHEVTRVKALATKHGEAVGDPVEPFETNNPQEVYEWVCATGATKQEAAEHWGYDSPRCAGDAVRRHCQARGIESPWGIANRGQLVPGRAEKAWKLKQEGHTWTEVAQRLGYSRPASANSSARKWAKRNGLI